MDASITNTAVTTSTDNNNENTESQVLSVSSSINQIGEGKVSVFIDIQGFLDNRNEIIVKELCYAFTDYQTEPKHLTFKPPYNLITLRSKARENVMFQTRLHHGLLWKGGDLNYKQLPQCLNRILYRKNIEAIYVQGKDQIMWLYMLFLNTAKPLPPIYDVFFMPSLDNAEFKRKTNNPVCSSKNHDWSCNEGSYDFWSIYSHPKHCALQNVRILREYYAKNIEQFSVFRREKDVYEEYEEI